MFSKLCHFLKYSRIVCPERKVKNKGFSLNYVQPTMYADTSLSNGSLTVMKDVAFFRKESLYIPSSKESLDS